MQRFQILLRNKLNFKHHRLKRETLKDLSLKVCLLFDKCDLGVTVMPLKGGLGGLAHTEFGVSVNPIPTRGALHYIALLLAHPDLKT